MVGTKKLWLALVLLLLVPSAFADSMELNVSTTNDLDADINLYSEGDMVVDVNVNSVGNTTFNTEYNNYQFIDEMSVTHVTSHKGVFSEIRRLFRAYFNPDERKYLSNAGLEALDYLSMFRESIVRGPEMHRMSLELEAQKHINRRLTDELDFIMESLKIPLSEHSHECEGYLQVMMMNNSGITSVTCMDRGVVKTWHKGINPGQAFMIVSVPTEQEDDNNTNETLGTIVMPLINESFVEVENNETVRD